MGAAGRTLGMGARRRTRMPRTHTARGRAQARAHPNVRCWAPEEGEACAAALGRARTHRANSIRHRPASSRRAASRAPAPRPGQPAAGQTPAPCHGIFSFLDLAMTGFGLWSVRFPLVLVRTGRRLPVQALCERRVLVALTGYPRGGHPSMLRLMVCGTGHGPRPVRDRVPPSLQPG